MASFQEVLGVLHGTVPQPASKFLSFSGHLDADQIDQLSDALRCSTLSGGVRLKGMASVTDIDYADGHGPEKLWADTQPVRHWDVQSSRHD